MGLLSPMTHLVRLAGAQCASPQYDGESGESRAAVRQLPEIATKVGSFSKRSPQHDRLLKHASAASA
jgi:hypothetical protein